MTNQHTTTRTRRLTSLLGASLLAATSTHAADVVKLSTGRLDTLASWDTGALPGSANTAVFNSTTAPIDVTFDGSGTASALTWGGLKVTDIAGSVTVTPHATITIGALGGTIIDMSAATNDVSFTAGATGASTVRLSTTAGGTINVATGRTLTFGKLTNNSGTKTYTMTGGGDVVMNGVSGTGGVFNLVVDGANVTLNTANVWSGGVTLASGSLRTNALTLAANRNFSFTSGIWEYQAGDQITATLGTGTFAITGGTLDLNSGISDYSITYTLLNGFASGSVAGLSITGYDTSNWIANLNDSGILSFTASAIPEPSAFAALAGAVGFGAAALRRRRRA